MLSAKRFGMEAEITDELYLKRIEQYESLMERLLPILLNTAYWGSEQSVPMMLGAIERVMTLKSQFGGYENWINLQLYPASLALYAIGLGLLASENYRAFKTLACDFRTGACELNRRINSAMERLGLQGAINKDLLNRAINQRQHVPYSERVHQLFSSIFLKQLP